MRCCCRCTQDNSEEDDQRWQCHWWYTQHPTHAWNIIAPSSQKKERSTYASERLHRNWPASDFRSASRVSSRADHFNDPIFFSNIAAIHLYAIHILATYTIRNKLIHFGCVALHFCLFVHRARMILHKDWNKTKKKKHRKWKKGKKKWLLLHCGCVTKETNSARSPHQCYAAWRGHMFRCLVERQPTLNGHIVCVCVWLRAQMN